MSANQRKFLIITLTAIVSAFVYFTYRLNKQLKSTVDKVDLLENKLQTLTQQSKTLQSERNIQMKITNTEHQVESEVETEEDEELNVQPPAVIMNSLHQTASTITNLNQHMAQLQDHMQRQLEAGAAELEEEDDEDMATPFESDDDEVTLFEGGDDGDEEDNEDDETQVVVEEEVEESTEVEAAGEGNVEVEEAAAEENEENEENEDVEIEYVIEYETETEDEELDGEELVSSISQLHTKNKLMDVLRSSGLSTSGNKDTLIKRLITIDNYQQALQA